MLNVEASRMYDGKDLGNLNRSITADNKPSQLEEPRIIGRPNDGVQRDGQSSPTNPNYRGNYYGYKSGDLNSRLRGENRDQRDNYGAPYNRLAADRGYG